MRLLCNSIYTYLHLFTTEWIDYFSREVVAKASEAIPALAVFTIFSSLCVSSH